MRFVLNSQLFKVEKKNKIFLPLTFYSWAYKQSSYNNRMEAKVFLLFKIQHIHRMLGLVFGFVL